MADFVAVLRKTIDGLADNNAAMRGRVYEKARSTVVAKLAAISPPPPALVAERQKQALEDAIREVEAQYSSTEPDPFAELESVFADIAPEKPKVEPLPAATIEPATNVSPASSVLPGSEVEEQSWPDQSRHVEPEPEPAVIASRPAVPFDGEEEEMDEEAGQDEPGFREMPERRRNFIPLIAAVVVLALVGGGAYAVWLNKDDFLAMLGMGNEVVATAPLTDNSAAPEQAGPEQSVPQTAKKPETEPAPSDGAPAAAPGVQKFTQRLNSDGTEVDEGPAGGIASIGEGTTVAAVTQPPTNSVLDATTPDNAAPDAAPTDGTVPAPAGDAAAAAVPGTDPAAAPADPAVAATGETTETDQQQVAVGQKAIFYEERTNVAEGSADGGSVVWSLVQESPGNDLPVEAAIRGEATIPGKDIQLRMTIRRNADKTLPASHIIELIFLTPENFEGGGIDNILRFALKDTEESAGSPVLGIPAKISDGFFLVALNDTKAEIETNLGLLKRERWIDIPLVYKSGRRALITMEKGVPGDKVFDEAIKAWQTATASAG